MKARNGTSATCVPGTHFEYFLNGVARQAEDASGRAARITSLPAKWKGAVSGSPSRAAIALIDLLAENPFWAVGRIAERLGVAFTTAQRAVDTLVRRRILTKVGAARRDRVFVAKAILNILDEPARLIPNQDS